jgi:N-acetyl-gamma-glutamyl-phosphate reductase
MGKIRVAIEGGAGYTAGELIRILLNHPMAEIRYVNSESHLGHSIAEVHPDLLGETDLKFSPIDFNDIDALFLCMAMGNRSSSWARTRSPRR